MSTPTQTTQSMAELVVGAAEQLGPCVALGSSAGSDAAQQYVRPPSGKDSDPRCRGHSTQTVPSPAEEVLVVLVGWDWRDQSCCLDPYQPPPQAKVLRHS